MAPSLYLLKLLVRQYGFFCLEEVSTKHQWIIPQGLSQERMINLFMMYNKSPHYATLKEAVNQVLCEKQKEKLEEATMEFDDDKAALLLLVYYESITMSYSTPKKHLDDEIRQIFVNSTLTMDKLPSPMRRMAHLFIINQQGGPIAQMKIDKELPLDCKILGALVIHSITTFSCRTKLPLLLPFVKMMTDPAALVNAYIPTMEEDTLEEVWNVRGGQFQECHRGHRYFVGECGQPKEELNCNVCGAKIERKDCAKAKINDALTGHVLGSVASRTSIPAPERVLSPPAICVIRALMHSALLWCACHKEDEIPNLAQLVKPFIHPPHLPEFFWDHLRKDLEQLSRVTGKGLEESAIIVHLVLKDILTTQPPTSSDTNPTVYLLGTKHARELWEKEFNTLYIQPVVGNLESRIDEVIGLIAHDQLSSLVYERKELINDNVKPHLWSYHQKISLEHLGFTLQYNELQQKYPILHQFLQIEPRLRATQYLPDIAQLQRCLFDRYHHRIYRRDARTETIAEFLNHDDVKSQKEYKEGVESLKKAWALVGQDLKTHGGLSLEEKHCLSVITDDLPLEYLIPTTSGAGACTTSIVDFLIRTHNYFIEKCHTIIAKKNQSESVKYSVSITHIRRCHLLDYEHQIVSVVLSHCNYSLKVDGTHSIQYDHEALDKHIMDKFIHGKPRILSDIPQIVYRTDIHTTVTFGSVRKNVSPQKRLESQMQKEIIAELRTPDRLQESLDVVDIVLGFLSSGKVRNESNKPLGEYIDKVLKMKDKPFSRKAQECKLHHVLSLWETLSVELARLNVLGDQEPFDSVHVKYTRALSEGDSNQKIALDKSLPTFDINFLLGALYMFIETYIKYLPHNQLSWSLRGTLVMEQFQYLEIRFPDKIPESITLDQTIAVWKHIVHYQQGIKTKTNLA